MEIVVKEREVLGSLAKISLPVTHSHLFLNCFSELERIEKTYSRFISGSSLSALNSNLGKWQNASDEMLMLISKAEEFRKNTEGNFDITLKSSLDSLGYDANYSFKPKKSKFDLFASAAAFLPPIQIDSKNKKVLLNRQIEFGGFGKGFALDQISKLLEKEGAKHYCINAGGDIFARRDKTLPPWNIVLEHPDDATKAIGKLELDGMAIAASAPNRRKWGKFHHLLNAKTKMPASGSKAIFVLANSGIEADAYSTAIFCSGFEEGILLSKKLPVEILLISSEGKMFQSQKFGAEIFS